MADWGSHRGERSLGELTLVVEKHGIVAAIDCHVSPGGLCGLSLASICWTVASGGE